MRHGQRGVGLVEVLVALLILAIAILGFSAMQIQSIKSTSESVDRSQTLLMMRSLAEKIRANSSAISTYQTAFNQLNEVEESKKFKQPSKLCVSTENDLCTATELANADVWRMKHQLDASGLKMNLQPCPSTGGGTATASSNIMYSYCLITAWGDTNPTIGNDDNPDDGSMDCLTPRNTTDPKKILTGGTYHPKATCMFLEVN